MMAPDESLTSSTLAGRVEVQALLTDPKVEGEWSPVIRLPNVPIHMHVLPTGKVLYWGRRRAAGSQDFDTLNEHRCVPFLWDPTKPEESPPTKSRPTLADGAEVNLFCSGHTFLADGRLLVIGGHLFDSQGTNQACLYDAEHDSWTATQTMNEGRWYPTAITLPDGSVLASSGSAPSGPLQKPPNRSHTNTIQQIWKSGAWRSIVDFIVLPLFPRLHVAPDGRVFMAGGNVQSFFLDVSGTGTWTPGPSRAAGNRDYSPSVMYEPGKVVFIGGGQDSDTQAPTSLVEVIDLNVVGAQWNQTSPMRFARRQHNATLLPDGTVLVTGGTCGDGFDNLTDGNPVHAAELWNPQTGQWSIMAAESVNRCYHSAAVLLPDGRVLSAGGGEYAPQIDQTNAAKDTHSNAQLFSPPYLFKGERPKIGNAPRLVTYGEQFDIETDLPGDISAVNWLRLPSVTHSFDQNQRFNRLTFVATNGKLSVTAPANANLCPPGHYMMFILNRDAVPSVARTVQIGSGVAAVSAAVMPILTTAPLPRAFVAPKRAPIVVGVTAACPYGLSACWGGAYQALTRLHDVEAVRDVPNGDDSTAEVYLKHDGLPDVDLWPAEFARVANGTHSFRGVEITLNGSVSVIGADLVLTGTDARPEVHLSPISPEHKIQWDLPARARKPLEPEEKEAFNALQACADAQKKSLAVTLTGPLLKSSSGYTLEVRRFTFR